MPCNIYQSLRSITVITAALCGLGASAEAESATDVDAIMDGTWQFSTVGTTAGMSSHPQDYTQVRRVHFRQGAFDKNPLGFESQGFRLLRCESPGTVSFEAPYGIAGGSYSMSFKGTGDANLTHLEGSFEFCMASGTFTAIHEAAEAEQTQLTVVVGQTTVARIRLTLKPDAAVVVHGVRERGDQKLMISSNAMTFTPENWDQCQDLTIDASAVKSPGKAYIGITGAGVPETYVAVKLVRATSSAH